MITFLSSPKPFKGVDRENQYKAINNWKTLSKDVEIILFGDSEGIDEAGQDLGTIVVKDIPVSSNGIPYFESISSYARDLGRFDIQIYLNCDILLGNIFDVLSLVKFENFLIIGQRIDLNEGVDIDFDSCKIS